MPIQENAVPAVLSESEKKLKSTALVVYVLYLLSWIIGITGLIGVIIAHIKKSDAAGTAFESHFSNQIKIFWIGLLLAIVGALTTFFVIGWLILGIAAIWVLYRTIKGLLRAIDGKAYG